MVALFIGGLGASTQHPLASSLMARAFEGPRSMKALGTYNFAGDIGKMTVPAATALLLVVMEWRPTLALLGACGLVAAVAIYLLTPRYGPKAASVADSKNPVEPCRHASRRALRFRCCCRSACSTARRAWVSCCSCRSC